MGQGDVGIDEGGSAVTESAVEGDEGGGRLSSSAAVFQRALLGRRPLPFQRPAASHDELVVEMGARRWRVRHIPKSAHPGQPAGERDGGIG